MITKDDLRSLKASVETAGEGEVAYTSVANATVKFLQLTKADGVLEVPSTFHSRVPSEILSRRIDQALSAPDEVFNAVASGVVNLG